MLKYGSFRSLNKGCDTLITETIEKIRNAETEAEKIEMIAEKDAECIIEKSKQKATEIIENAKAAGEAYLAKKMSEAQKTADESSIQNDAKIDSEVKAMGDAVYAKYGQTVSKIKKMLIS